MQLVGVTIGRALDGVAGWVAAELFQVGDAFERLNGGSPFMVTKKPAGGAARGGESGEGQSGVVRVDNVWIRGCGSCVSREWRQGMTAIGQKLADYGGFGQYMTFNANRNSNPKIVKYQIKGPETYSQRKVSSSGGANSRKRKATTHWVHLRNFSSISYILINSLMVLWREIHIKHHVCQ